MIQKQNHNHQTLISHTIARISVTLCPVKILYFQSCSDGVRVYAILREDRHPDSVAVRISRIPAHFHHRNDVHYRHGNIYRRRVGPLSCRDKGMAVEIVIERIVGYFVRFRNVQSGSSIKRKSYCDACHEIE